VGDELSTYFWKDRWINGFTTAELAPEVVARIPTRRKNERLVGEALPEDGWIDDMSGEMTEELYTLEGSRICAEGGRKPGPHLLERGGSRKVYGERHLRYPVPREHEVEHE
jgi:hypothetical protein